MIVLTRQGACAVFVFEIEANDVYAVLGRVLNRTRVVGLRLAAVSAAETDGGYTISATVDTADSELVERLARQFGGMIGVTAVSVERAPMRRPSAFAGLNAPPTACPAPHEETAHG